MIDITAEGYIEVWKDGAVLSRHRAEREAFQSCAKHGVGRYRLTYPDVAVEITDVSDTFGTINGALQV